MIYNLFDVKNTPYFVLTFGILIILLVAFAIYKLFKFERNFVSNKVQILSRIEIDPITGEEIIKMSLVNRGFNSVDVRGFGFKHYNHDYDYLKLYKEEHDMKPTDKVVIGARETLETVIDLDNLKSKLNSKKIKKFKAYAIDSYGNYALRSAKYVERYIELFFAKVEFVERVEAMTPDKQMKYKQKEAKLDARAKGVIAKSLKTKLNNDELNYTVQTEEKVETVNDTPVEQPVIQNEAVVENKAEALDNKAEEVLENETDNIEVKEEATEEAQENIVEENESYISMASDEEVVAIDNPFADIDEEIEPKE